MTGVPEEQRWSNEVGSSNPASSATVVFLCKTLNSKLLQWEEEMLYMAAM